jgi:murein DD-endopeptidase MepM/ murein hydrolase activator NlpD
MRSSHRRLIAIAPVMLLSLEAARVRGAGQSASVSAAPAQAPVLSWTPLHPRQGTVARLVLSPASSDTRLRGEIAGEPLHFQPAGRDSLVALAPVPIDSTGTLHVILVIARADGQDTVRAALPIALGSYPMERLRVAPRFGEPPDAALARRLEDEARRAREVSQAAHETPRLWSLPFRVPRPGRVTSAFGGGREFNGTVTSRHMGTDFAGAVGAPVRAANRGVVRLVGRFYLGGNVVYVDHGAGLVTAYLHLSATRVAAGDTVERGEVIGAVGATGRVTGPHLHLIARYGQITVDPMSLIRITAGRSGA